jgi:pimeloyl-ACP methyl ester carboxylesterase
VVFESGMGASCLSWTLVQPQVAQFTRAVSYDRAGHGWSDPVREPRTAQQIAQELHTLLDATGVPGPYVLVGHSFGGYVNRAFAHTYRNEVVIPACTILQNFAYSALACFRMGISGSAYFQTGRVTLVEAAVVSRRMCDENRVWSKFCHTSVQTTERYVGLNSKFVMP